MRRGHPRVRIASRLSSIHRPTRSTASEGAAEDPVGTVVTALKTWRLAPGVLDESRWAVFSRRELV